jgi:hypothetical protein
MTKRARPHFRLAEYPGGDLWIVIEQLDGDPLEMCKRTIGFDLPSGMKREDADIVRRFLADNVVFLAET